MKAMKNMKLFGPLRILDVVAILSIVVIILPALHYYIRFNEKGLIEQKLLDRYIGQQTRAAVGFQKGPQIGTIDVAVSFKDISKEDLNKIRVHEREVLSDGTVLAEILEVGQPVPNYFIIDLGNPTFQKSVLNDSLYAVPAIVRLKGLISDGGFISYKAKAVKNLSFFTFNSGSWKADFVVEKRSLPIE